MSKSLKNFTTIREAIARGDWNARSLRIIFLLGGWHDGVEITDGKEILVCYPSVTLLIWI
jgi:cysteinyl-tRNA synthetase